MPLTNTPNFLAAIDKKRKRVFVLATPYLSAVRINGAWELCTPLSDEEIEQYELITDLEAARLYVQDAKDALGIL